MSMYYFCLIQRINKIFTIAASYFKHEGDIINGLSIMLFNEESSVLFDFQEG